MRNGTFVASVLLAMLAAGTTLGGERDRGTARAETQSQTTAPGWIGHGFARVERAMKRLETRLSGRDRGGMMDSCQDMMGSGMMDGRMMGGLRPNDRWRDPEGKR